MFNNEALGLQIPTPLHQADGLLGNRLENAPIYIKRDDLIHPAISGNKWRKLSSWLKLWKPPQTIVTFGGPHSNHLHAVGYLCSRLKLSCKMILKDRHVSMDSPVLNDLRRWDIPLFGMPADHFARAQVDLVFCREKLDFDATNSLIIPMGGAGIAAYRGVVQMVNEVHDELGVHNCHWMLAAGTGTMAAGIINSVPVDSIMTVYIPFRNERIARGLTKQISGLGAKRGIPVYFIYPFDMDFGTMTQSCADLLAELLDEYAILFDPVYNGPMVYAATKKEKQLTHGGRPTVIVHSGGIQGWRGMVARYKNDLNFQDQLIRRIPG